MEGGGRTPKKCGQGGAKGPRRGPEGWAQRVGPLSPGLGFRSECRSLGFVLFGFRKFGQNTETLKLAKVGLAKVGQHQNTKTGQSRFGQSRP